MFASQWVPTSQAARMPAAATLQCRHVAGAGDWVGGPGWVLVVCFEGSAEIRTAEGQWALAAGEVQVVEGPVVVCAGRAAGSVWGVVAGSPAEWSWALGELGLPPARRFVPTGDYRLTPDQLQRLRTACELGAQVPARRVMETLGDPTRWSAGLIEQIGRCPGRSGSQRRRVHARLQRARNLLRARCSQGRHTRQAAALVGYTVGHFQRIFHRVFGETVQGFVLGRRLELARQLLEGTRLSIGDVGLSAGFESRWAFARQFRQRYGVTAGVFRRQAALDPSRALSAQRPLPTPTRAAPRHAGFVPNVIAYPDAMRLPAA